MSRMQGNAIQGVGVLLLVLLFAPGLAAAGTFVDGIPEGWTCAGTCGTASANGVVTAAPSGASAYGWVATTGSSFRQAALPGIGGTNGSQLRSRAFSAQAGQDLAFDFNYVTSDGGGFADYAWARLLDAELEPVALLFTARTRSSGTIVPGFGMPEIEAEMTPETVHIIGGGPRWSPLGGDSGRCFSSGCGYTGWVRSVFSIPQAGDYVLEFGVVNWSDTLYQSGLAFDGVTVGGQPIDAQADYRDVQVVARLPTQGIELIPESFATVPVRITPFEDHIEIEWFFEAFSLGQLEALDHQVPVLNPQPGERRVVIEEVLLRYRDLAGVEHQRRLGPFDLEVLESMFALDLVLDRAHYTVGETVLIDTWIANLGEAAAIAAVQLDVRDAAGHPVRSLAGFEGIEVEAQATRALTQRRFDTAGLYAGTYQVHARVREMGADAGASAYASFHVDVPADTGLSAAVLADQGFYDPLETVTLIGRLRNTAPNLQIEGHSARLQVLDPQGQEFWRAEEGSLGALGAGGEQEWVRSLPLGPAAAGPYRVILTARDAEGIVRAVA